MCIRDRPDSIPTKACEEGLVFRAGKEDRWWHIADRPPDCLHGCFTIGQSATACAQKHSSQGCERHMSFRTGGPPATMINTRQTQRRNSTMRTSRKLTKALLAM